MKILYLYRNRAMGYSIGKVFAPIETTFSEHEEVDSLSMPDFLIFFIGCLICFY